MITGNLKSMFRPALNCVTSTLRVLFTLVHQQLVCSAAPGEGHEVGWEQGERTAGSDDACKGLPLRQPCQT